MDFLLRLKNFIGVNFMVGEWQLTASRQEEKKFRNVVESRIERQGSDSRLVSESKGYEGEHSNWRQGVWGEERRRQGLVRSLGCSLVVDVQVGLRSA